MGVLLLKGRTKFTDSHFGYFFFFLGEGRIYYLQQVRRTLKICLKEVSWFWY